MKFYFKYIVITVVFLGFVSIYNFVAQEHGHDHHHGQSDSQHQLKLNNGKKWATDKPLRKNMSEIHEHLKKILNESKLKKAKVSDYQKLGNNLKLNINNIFKTCKLEPKADAQLHLIMAELLKAQITLSDSSGLVMKKDAMQDVISSYKTYLKYFDSEDAH